MNWFTLTEIQLELVITEDWYELKRMLQQVQYWTSLIARLILFYKVNSVNPL